MYKKLSLTARESQLGSAVLFGAPEVPNLGRHRSMSYYVLGGVDIDGEALRMTGEAEFDTDAEILSGTSPNAGYDPRISGFDIAEKAGVDAYNRMKSESEGKSGLTSVTDVTEPTE